MPIEIKELHIRVNVTLPAEGEKKATSSQNSGENAGGSDSDSIIAESVEKVLEIIKNKTER
jgi:hypothetical protein